MPREKRTDWSNMMNFLIDFFQQSPGRLDPGQKVLLVAVVLGCVVLIVHLVRHLLHLERRLQSIDSQLLNLSKESGAS